MARGSKNKTAFILYSYLLKLPWSVGLDQYLSYSRKNPNRGGWEYTFLKKPLEFFIFYFTSENFRQNMSQPLDIQQNCVCALGNFKAKNIQKTERPLEIPHHFFLASLVNSTLFLINPWKLHIIIVFLWSPCPGNSISSNPPVLCCLCLDFFWTSPPNVFLLLLDTIYTQVHCIVFREHWQLGFIMLNANLGPFNLWKPPTPTPCLALSLMACIAGVNLLF